jgi:hypothetical protein
LQFARRIFGIGTLLPEGPHEAFVPERVVGAAQIEVGIAQVYPSTVKNSLDQDVIQIAALLSDVADEVLLEEPYRTTLGDGVWASTRTASRGPTGRSRTTI